MIDSVEFVPTATFEGHACFGAQKPFYVVVHGTDPFSYGHYGVHLGQQDRLTFIGDPGRKIRCSLLDCRAGSISHGARLKLECQVDPTRALCIPQGVAHTFDGLECVFTINDYHLFLPTLDSLVNGTSEWTIENDVLNVALDAAEVPAIVENTAPAGKLLYSALEDHHRAQALNGPARYPIVQDMKLGGKIRRVRLTPIYESEEHEVPTVGEWSRHRLIASGEDSGVIPFSTGLAVLVQTVEEVERVAPALGWRAVWLTFLTHKPDALRIGGAAVTAFPEHELHYDLKGGLAFKAEAGSILMREAPAASVSR